MLGEPLLLGLLVAPSWAGAGIAVAAVGAFLARHPLKLALADWHRRQRYPRTAVAERFVLIYGAVTAAGLALAAAGGTPGWWWPLAVAAPLALAQLAYDASHQGRRLLPELLGGVALGSVAAAEMRAADLPLAAALAAWVLLAAKATATVVYVRARLRCDRGLAPNRAGAVAAHAGAFVLAATLALGAQAPWLATAAFALLLARSLHGLSRFHRRVRAQVVGVQEIAYGFSFVLVVALGYAIGL
jgi:YwiC-like protein